MGSDVGDMEISDLEIRDMYQIRPEKGKLLLPPVKLRLRELVHVATDDHITCHVSWQRTPAIIGPNLVGNFIDTLRGALRHEESTST